ncbi:flagellar biosynthetic protein FliR [Nocardioides deserti]|uniref:Flagellar biosynthetic protein FliR n=1 Tax=Nocardioides deserti TaxID=1588644 RepID=A0ABR6UD77_9ACTN|nr:flagellar biosynthetic protein FliR [Nocardioides deserti]MBC2962406.1 flagellar biosynthetic protein FliR [Nocardioides deserti]GGO77930.1 flagellar biosynthetic protein FliR [Nocardioides deserti]
MTLTVAGEPLLTYLLASVRIIAWLAVVQPFSSRTIPAPAKVVLALGLAFAVTPSLAAGAVPLDAVGLVMTVLTQVVLGAAMGYVTSLLFAAVAAAGALIDVFGGFSLAQAFDPLGMNASTVLGNLHQWLATVLLFVSGGYLIVVGGLLRSFAAVPIGQSPELPGGVAVLTSVFELFFITAVQIALPMAAVLFITDLGLALLTKVAPQLNAINVVFPAKIGLTLLLVGLSFPVLPGVVDRLVEAALKAMAAIVGAS